MYIPISIIAPIISFLLFGQIIETQETPSSTEETFLNCGSTILHEELSKKDPSYRSAQEKYETMIFQTLKNRRRSLKSNNSFTLPVVFHIVHENGNENISDALIQQGLDDLNEAFANTGYYDPNTGVNTGIQFCLAQQDPDGQSTTGINRIQHPLTNVDMDSEDRMLKDLMRWQPIHYINVWLVKEICRGGGGCGVAGYAYLPGAHGGNVDGIVMEARWMGRSKASSTVLVHEMGHYLGLYHTFDGGCDNDDCARNGDRVCDTPPDQSTVAVPCGGSANTCNTDTNSGFATDQVDMFWNYMDYGRFDCYSAFTQGQTDRMVATIEGRRASLLESLACFAPCTENLSVSITPDVSEIEVGSSITFSPNGTNTDRYKWYLNRVLQDSTENWTHQFDQVGGFQIVVRGGNNDPGCFIAADTLQIRVVCTIDASFAVDTTTIIAGDTLDFTNNSTNYNNLEWSINGNTVGNGEVLTHIFNSVGAFNVTLKATNDFCEDFFQQFITVIDPADCDQTPVLINIRDVSGEDYHVFDDGTSVHRKIANNGVEVFKLNNQKNIDWSRRRFDLSTGNTAINRLGGSIYTVSHNGGLVKLYKQGREGLLEWSTQTQSSINATKTPLVSANRSDEVLVGIEFEEAGTPFFHLNKLDGNGNLLWSSRFEEGVLEKVLLDDIGESYVVLSNPSDSRSLRILKIGATGTVDWVKELNNPSPLSFNKDWCVLSEDGGIILFFSFGLPVEYKIFSLGANGQILWTNLFSSNAALLTIELPTLRKGLGNNYHLLFNHRGNSFSIATINNKGDVNNIRQYFQPITGGLTNERIQLEVNEGNGAYVVDFGQNLEDFTTIWRSLAFSDPAGTFGECVASEPIDFFLDPSQVILTDITLMQSAGPNFVNEAIDLVDGLPVTVVPLCYNFQAPELTLEVSDAAFCGGIVSATATVCNIGNLVLEGEVPINFYNGNPISGGALVDVQFLPFILRPDSCFSLALQIQGENLDSLYGIVNVDAYFADLFGEGDEPGNFIFECDYNNNVDSVEVIQDNTAAMPISLGSDTTLCTFDSLILNATDQFAEYRWQDNSTDSIFVAVGPGTYFVEAVSLCGDIIRDSLIIESVPNLNLDLGPDIERCENGVIPLNAGGQFISYLWQDGSTDSIFTAWEDGLFWVEAIDQCGVVYSDTVRITVDMNQQFDLGSDQVICNNQTLSITGPTGFQQYRWFPTTYLDCDTCTSVTITPDGMIKDSSITYQLLATSSLGCISTDSVLVQFSGAIFSSDTISLCDGDTLFYQGAIIIDSITVVDTLVTTQGCDSITTLVVQLEDTIETFDMISICEGDSVQLFGNWIDQPGLYFEAFTAVSGCDSIHTVEVFTEPILSVSDTLSICPGDTILLFGEMVTDSGIYTSRRPAIQGCDTLLSTTVQLSTPFTITDTINICPGDTILLFGEMVTDSGIYTSSRPAIQGCDTLLSTTVQLSTPITITDTINICPGDTILLFGEMVTDSGIYTSRRPAIQGCDTLLSTTVQFSTSFTTTDTLTICPGDSTLVFGEWVQNEGLYQDSMSDCDSLVQVRVIWDVVPIAYDTFEICQNDTLFVYDIEISSPGSYQSQIPAGDGCDSLLQIEVRLREISTSIDTLYICSGDSVSVFGTFIEAPGRYQEFSATEDGCDSVTIIDVFLLNNPMVTILLPEVYQINQGDFVQLFPDVPPSVEFTYEWFPTTGLSCSDCLDPNASPDTTTQYQITLTDREGCRYFASTIVMVEESTYIEVPNVFSPNGDGQNDILSIRTDSNVEQISLLQVFDRWGNLVYELRNFTPNDPNLGWNGVVNGQRQNSGVFVYYLEAKGSEGQIWQKSGEFLLLN